MTATVAPNAQPTADKPEIGCISLGGVPLSQVAYWVEDGEHVFRSTEYDVLAAAPDFAGAVVKFIENSEDYAKFIADLFREDEASLEEAEVALTLIQRFAEVYRQQRDAARQEARRLIRIPRRRPGNVAPDGYRRSPQRKLSERSPA
jgi:hypothetical protein